MKLGGEDGEARQGVQEYWVVRLAVLMKVRNVVSMEYQVLEMHVT